MVQSALSPEPRVLLISPLLISRIYLINSLIGIFDTCVMTACRWEWGLTIVIHRPESACGARGGKGVPGGNGNPEQLLPLPGKFDLVG